MTDFHIPGHPRRGDLVKVRMREPYGKPQSGLVLEYYDSNVYEPAYVRVLFDDCDISFVRVRDCTIVSMVEDRDRLEKLSQG